MCLGRTRQALWWFEEDGGHEWWGSGARSLRCPGMRRQDSALSFVVSLDFCPLNLEIERILHNNIMIVFLATICVKLKF